MPGWTRDVQRARALARVAQASVDPSTGVVTADNPGTATISVLSGGVTGSVTVTVTG